MRVISDVHGKLTQYFEVANNSPDGYSLQLGDLGFDYSSLYDNLDISCHYFQKGNHDNYDVDSPYDLHSRIGFRYGELPNCLVEKIHIIDKPKTFFCGGGASIDAAARVIHYLHTGQKTWWYEEELDLEARQDAVDVYKVIKPDIMFSHEFPSSVTDIIMGNDTGLLQKCGLSPLFSSRTATMLQVMLKFHKPKYWFGGHLHRNFDKVIDGCHFICMRELGYIDI